MVNDLQISRIRMFYLYLFSGIGLVVFLFGIIATLEVAMKAWVFPTQDEMLLYSTESAQTEVLPQPEAPQRTEEESDEDYALRVAEYQKARQAYEQSVAELAAEQQALEERQVALAINRRNRDLASGVTQALVGFLVLAYHWHIVQSENRPKPASAAATGRRSVTNSKPKTKTAVRPGRKRKK